MKRVFLLTIFLTILLVSFAACDFFVTPSVGTGRPETSVADSVLSDTAEPEIEQTEPVNSEPAETGPVETLPVETKPAETQPVETKPVETQPAETQPVETKPVETEPVETKPVETQPVETLPAETKPVETQPAETQPVETKPVETEPAETEPAETETVHTHSWSAWQNTKQPTCTESGLLERICSCGEKEQEPVAALGHTPGAKATCTTAQTCTVCHVTLTPATGHTYGEWYETKAPTETAQGEKRRDCGDCDAYETAPLSPLAHDHNNWPATILPGVAPSCTTPGKTEGKKCSNCGEILVAQNSIPATGHSFGEWYETKAPTETTQGEKRRDCGDCDAYETAPVAPLAHDHNNWPATILPGVAPSCTTPGKTEGKKCSNCGEILVAQNSIPATGHSFGEWYETKAPTETTQGEKRRDCGDCDAYETAPVAPLAHDHNNWPATILPGVTPTCTTPGKTEGKVCSGCGEILVAQTELPVTDHKYRITVQEVSCTTQGYTAYICIYCEGGYVRDYQDALGHSFGEWYVTKAPTETEEGEKRRDCARCGEFETAAVEVQTHNHADWGTVILPGVMPTCTTPGKTEGKKCAGCGEILVPQTSLDPVSHDYAMHGNASCGKEACKLFHSCRYCGFSLLIPLEDRYFFKQLSKAQQENIKAVYNALVAGETDFITLPNAMKDPEADSDVIASFLYNCCPELVQLSSNEMRRWWRGNGEVKFQLVLSKAEFDGYCISLFDFLDDLNQTTAHMSDWEKSKFVYDLIMDRTVYEAKASDAVNKHEGSALGPLAAGRARCQGYANAYQLCTWATGLECWMITGVAGPENGPHAWNIIKLNGHYYLSDVTWDDGEDGTSAYAFFNVSTDEFVQHTAHSFWLDWNMPVCDRMDMSIFEIYDSYIESHENLTTEFSRILEANYNKNYVIYLKLEDEEDFATMIDGDVMQQCMQAFVNKHHLSVSWGISYWSEARVICLELDY